VRIKSAKGEFDGRDSQRHKELKIQVTAYGCPPKIFRHVDARDFEIWKKAGYPVDAPPFDIQEQFEAWKHRIQKQEKAWKR
jgi:hypothetical protein